MKEKILLFKLSTVFKQILLALIFLSYTGCYTLNSHQTGKTVGKGNQTYQLLYGLAGVPSFKDENNWGTSGLMLPQSLIIFGLADKFDIGFTIGLNKSGLLTKYQFVGNQKSRFAVATGLSGFVGLNEYTILSNQSYYSFELPVYLSYEIDTEFTIYMTPCISYINGNQRSYYSRSEVTLLDNDLYEGLILGVSSKLTDEILISLEASYQSPLINNNYIFYITAGFGIKVNALKKENRH